MGTASMENDMLDVSDMKELFGKMAAMKGGIHALKTIVSDTNKVLDKEKVGRVQLEDGEYASDGLLRRFEGMDEEDEGVYWTTLESVNQALTDLLTKSANEPKSERREKRERNEPKREEHAERPNRVDWFKLGRSFEAGRTVARELNVDEIAIVLPVLTEDLSKKEITLFGDDKLPFPRRLTVTWGDLEGKDGAKAAYFVDSLWNTLKDFKLASPEDRHNGRKAREEERRLEQKRKETEEAKRKAEDAKKVREAAEAETARVRKEREEADAEAKRKANMVAAAQGNPGVISTTGQGPANPVIPSLDELRKQLADGKDDKGRKLSSKKKTELAQQIAQLESLAGTPAPLSTPPTA